jgi:hypothetical protein
MLILADSLVLILLTNNSTLYLDITFLTIGFALLISSDCSWIPPQPVLLLLVCLSIKRYKMGSWAWWHTTVISATQEERQEGHESEASVDRVIPYLKNKIQNKRAGTLDKR